MIDDELYRETFSKLRASEQAKREVLMKIQEKKTKRRLPKVLRSAAIAAVLVVALAVTASAAETDLLDFISVQLTTIFDDGFHSVAVDEEGKEWNAYNMTAETELRDGRLILKAMTQEFDITDDLQDNGEAVHTFYKDDFDMTVTVTGTLEKHTISTSSEAGSVSMVSEPMEPGEVYTTMTTVEGEDSDSDSTNIADESNTWSDIESDSHGQYEIISDDGRVLVSDVTK